MCVFLCVCTTVCLCVSSPPPSSSRFFFDFRLHNERARDATYTDKLRTIPQQQQQHPSIPPPHDDDVCLYTYRSLLSMRVCTYFLPVIFCFECFSLPVRQFYGENTASTVLKTRCSKLIIYI